MSARALTTTKQGNSKAMNEFLPLSPAQIPV